ncbi:hypothetical protein SVAN01_10697 [Stagonosporopsis vannaccii]|nr:hypothetical protein SVAN01_10697 [Stagonosporopsis vannaccii]
MACGQGAYGGEQPRSVLLWSCCRSSFNVRAAAPSSPAFARPSGLKRCCSCRPLQHSPCQWPAAASTIRGVLVKSCPNGRWRCDCCNCCGPARSSGPLRVRRRYYLVLDPSKGTGRACQDWQTWAVQNVVLGFERNWR